MYNLWLDDERPLPSQYASSGDPWVVAKSFDEARKFVKTYGIPNLVDFDHDLGEGKTGYDFAKWLCGEVLSNSTVDDYIGGIGEDQMFRWLIHSANPVGRDNIKNYIEGFENRNIIRF